MSEVFSLEGRVAVVTGLSSGIGQAIATALAREGAEVAGDYRSNEAGADETVRRIEALGRRALTLRGDTADEAHVQALAAAAEERFGRLDIWVNNAARILVRPFFETTTPASTTSPDRKKRGSAGRAMSFLLTTTLSAPKP